jgi:hypothetical protein
LISLATAAVLSQRSAYDFLEDESHREGFVAKPRFG